ncbi:UPF0182 family protein [Desulfoscipio geothermicus]|uniref:UPF0182 protein SAMN05660706_11338 n=1 Tax=Desulfoscipio geothermicus DSM 3669 TaxID=1121426 RepID=A0A1I6DLJ6_9FIRM|nr:UPF0182 family protein [Desulfoscipio geothermicus]SFR06294.1 hypothetical protein SAMN05660706_11338 [Desulfoscipio geothermicus DSM 3669]
MHKGLKWLTSVAAIIIILFLLVARWGANLYVEWLWFQSLGYSNVFKTILLSELGLRFLVGVLTFIFIFVNLMLTRKTVLQRVNTRQYFENGDVITIHKSQLNKYLTPRFLTVTYLAISSTLAFFVSTAVTGDWVILQKFLHSTAFGYTDPIFHNNIGKYVFSLPFYQFIYQLVNWFIILAAFTVALVYFLTETGQEGFGKLFSSISARLHLSFLAALFFLARAWGFRLEQYMLLYSDQGVVFGPGYTDIHARLLAYKALFIIAILIALVIIINLFLRRFKLILYSIGALFLASVILGGIYPSIIQNLVVKPNELNKEQPYIANSIKYTRLAYNLDNVEIKKFPAGKKLTAADIENNRDTIKNIRLWDWRPLQQTYAQLQEIRPYYELQNIDIDRYMINDTYRQVMLAARELDQEQLPRTAQTWINQRLKYTHGYGIAMSPVNEMTTEGLPEFFIKNIPPVEVIEKEVTQPEIYFGELTDNYIIVITKAKEFDYPVGGNENAYTTYQGRNGVQMGGLFRRAIFALAFGDYKMLLATDVKNSSQILFYRNIHDRVPRLAPFLRYDSDPYIVLGDTGALYWMWDAYTVSDMYPYSQPFSGRNNYIRNSVKIVVNAYTGQVDFYIADNKDPLIQTYAKIFPGVFKPLAEMPEDLQRHIRYPADLFSIQAEKYTVYHMTDTEVLYYQEDKWSLPTEKFFNEEVDMEPYYTIIRLPGEAKPEYVLILPFTPKNKTNMIGWMAARSDEPNYGKLIVYEFPKQELIYGPMQIEARIDQDTTISQQLTLWNQRGSSVIRGNLLVIPVKDALLYVEPLYLQAEQSKMPELRRVIVAHGDQVVMEPTLDIALHKIFGDEIDMDRTIKERPPVPGDNPPATLKDLINQANQLYNEAQARLKDGDWAGYGEAIARLKDTLNTMSEQAKQEP